jgi:hypothetical protein
MGHQNDFAALHALSLILVNNPIDFFAKSFADSILELSQL